MIAWLKCFFGHRRSWVREPFFSVWTDEKIKCQECGREWIN